MSDRLAELERELGELDKEIRGGRGYPGVYGRIGEIEGRVEGMEAQIVGVQQDNRDHAKALRDLAAALVEFKAAGMSREAVFFLCVCALASTLAFVAIAGVTVANTLQSRADVERGEMMIGVR